ncbi:helix-turn-helix domain-containing protein, partial [candidate division KSB1 bacterium]
MEEDLIFDGKKYVTTAEAGERLNYTSYYITSFCRAGDLSCKKIGKAWLVEEDSLLEFKKNRETEKEDKNNQLKEVRKAEYERKNKPKPEKVEEDNIVYELPQTNFQHVQQVVPPSVLKEEAVEEIKEVKNPYEEKPKEELNTIRDAVYPRATFVSETPKLPTEAPSTSLVSPFVKIPATLLIASMFVSSGFYIGGHQDELKQKYSTTIELSQISYNAIVKQTKTAFIETLEYSKDSFATLKDKTEDTTTQLATASYTAATNAYATSY